MGQFVLIRGRHTAYDPVLGRRRTFTRGDVVTLNPTQAEAFRDKFKAIEVVAAEARVATAQSEAAIALAEETNRHARTPVGRIDPSDSPQEDTLVGEEEEVSALPSNPAKDTPSLEVSDKSSPPTVKADTPKGVAPGGKQGAVAKS